MDSMFWRGTSSSMSKVGNQFKKICGCSAVVRDLIVIIGHIGLIHRQLRRMNVCISSHLKVREASLEMSTSINWIEMESKVSYLA